MDVLIATFLIILGSFLFLILVLIGIGTILIFTGPPDLHDVAIDPHAERKPKTK
jgi:hypothetical protein